MKDETTNSYELTLTPNYVSDWNFNDALRELIQNGTDQEVLDPDNEFQIDYSPKEKVLRLKNRKSVLKINGRIREAGEGGERIMAEVKIWPRGQTETGGILLMPMKKNIPKGHPEWSLVKCPICGQECWRPISRQELRQKKMQAACTECGLKIESRRNQP